jgi:hypothetical protein
MEINKRLRKLGIDSESELGRTFIKLDELYSSLEDIDKDIKFKLKHKEQILEDIDMAEMMIMYKFNKDTRLEEWYRQN